MGRLTASERRMQQLARELAEQKPAAASEPSQAEGRTTLAAPAPKQHRPRDHEERDNRRTGRHCAYNIDHRARSKRAVSAATIGLAVVLAVAIVRMALDFIGVTSKCSPLDLLTLAGC